MKINYSTCPFCCIHFFVLSSNKPVCAFVGAQFSIFDAKWPLHARCRNIEGLSQFGVSLLHSNSIFMFVKVLKRVIFCFEGGLREDPDSNGPFVPFFYSQSIIESRSGSRCFSRFLSTQIDAVTVVAKNIDSSSDRRSIEVRKSNGLKFLFRLRCESAACCDRWLCCK